MCDRNVDYQGHLPFYLYCASRILPEIENSEKKYTATIYFWDYNNFFLRLIKHMTLCSYAVLYNYICICYC